MNVQLESLTETHHNLKDPRKNIYFLLDLLSQSSKYKMHYLCYCYSQKRDLRKSLECQGKLERALSFQAGRIG